MPTIKNTCSWLESINYELYPCLIDEKKKAGFIEELGEILFDVKIGIGFITRNGTKIITCLKKYKDVFA